MATTASTQDEWTIHALNIHGVFFERKCATLVANTPGWNVLAANYPVEFPPPNGPWRGKESSLDIWARRDADSTFVVDALLECKKANPEFVNWVFFPKPRAPAPAPFGFTRAYNKSDDVGSELWSTQLSLDRTTTTMLMANEAREVRGDYLKYQKNDKTKTSNAAIQEAAYQVALATRAIVHEERSLLKKARLSPSHPEPPWTSKAYVPLIVTTAKLFAVEFLANNVKVDSGEIDPHDARLNPVESIVFEYALPKHLQFPPADPLQTLQSGNSDLFSRMHILVVHAESLSIFLESLFSSASQQESTK